jgi:redox-sensing transcriptional repressor
VTKTKKTGSKTAEISDSSIRPISIYIRAFNRLEMNGVNYITSQELAEIKGLRPAQVRKDLSYFGCFGQIGVGYNVGKLKNELARILGLDRERSLVVIGCAQYCGVLMNSIALKLNNFHIHKRYDENPENFNCVSGEINFLHIERLEETLDPDKESIVIIALPPPEVQDVIDRLSRIGGRAAVYLASRCVNVPDNMVILNHDISIGLGMLTYHLNEMNRE